MSIGKESIAKVKEEYERVSDEVLHFFADLALLRLSGLLTQSYSCLGTRVLGEI